MKNPIRYYVRILAVAVASAALTAPTPASAGILAGAELAPKAVPSSATSAPGPELQAELVAQLHAYLTGYRPVPAGEVKVTGISPVGADSTFLYVEFALRYRELYYGQVLWTVNGSARGRFTLGELTPDKACIAAPLTQGSALAITSLSLPTVTEPVERDHVKAVIAAQFPRNVCVPLYPSITINNIGVSECYESYKGFRTGSVARFSVTLSNRSARTILVTYASADGTAQAGSDYGAIAGTLTIPPLAAGGTISLQLRYDGVSEPDETFFVCLSDAVNATMVTDRGQATIIDQDSD